MTKRMHPDTQVIETALRMAKYGLGELIWMDENNIHPGSDLNDNEVAKGQQLATELELRGVEAVLPPPNENETRIVWIDARVARTLSSQKAEKVTATAMLEKWGRKWEPLEVDIEFRGDCAYFDFDDIESSSLPPLEPQTPRVVQEENELVVTIERFTNETDRDQMLIRVSGRHGVVPSQLNLSYKAREISSALLLA